MKELRYINQYFLKYKYRFLAGFVISIVSRFLMIKIPNFVKKSVDVASNYQKGHLQNLDFVKEQLLAYIFWIVGLAIVSGVFTFLMRQMIIVASRWIEFDLKNDIFRHYLKLSQNFYKQNRTGDLMSRISEDVSKVRMYFGPAVMYTINMITLLSIAIWNMFSINITLTFYALLPLPFLSFVIFKLSRTIHKRNTGVQTQLAALTTFVQEMFSGIELIKSYALESKTFGDFKNMANKNKNKNIHLHKAKAFFFPSMVFLIGLSNLLVIYIGGLQYEKGIISLGTIAEFVMYINLFTWPVAVVGWVTATVQEAESCQKRINEFLKQKPEIINGTRRPRTFFREKITFENVNLTYPHTKITALKNINFSIKKGETIAIMGPTGAGKTSILEMLCRIYEPTKGNITIDNINIKDFDLEILRKNMGVVPQDSFLFSDTIENNILFGKNSEEKYEKQDIIKAAKKACVHENIITFEKGYQTILGERGVTLSGGQKQRIAIARALIKNSEILLLDDCLSAVDTQTETNILKNLKTLQKTKTTIMITGRISVSKQADTIIVLEKGTLTQKGTHENLKEKEGFYKKLYLKQKGS